MHAMASAVLLAGLGRLRFVGLPAVCLLVLGAVEQFFRFQSEPLNRCGDSRPLFTQELLPLPFEQQFARAGVNEHAQATSRFDQTLIYQFLITLQNREWIHAILSRHIADRRQRIAFFEYAVEDHGDDAVPQLAVNRLAVIPLTV